MRGIWGQGCNYNAQTPVMMAGPCGHALTGCTATALGQVVLHHQHAPGHTYSWSLMPSGSTGSINGKASRAQLLSDLGVAASASYGATSTTATTANAAAALRSFGYDAVVASLTSLSTIALTEIDASRPLLIRGSSATAGHIWDSRGERLRGVVAVSCVP